MIERIILLLLSAQMLYACGVSHRMDFNAERETHYVSEEYSRRAEGYDWSVVSLRPLGRDSVHISVRSRMDKKKPSKTFDGVGRYAQGRDTITVMWDNTPIYFGVKGKSLCISSPSESMLRYFCSGGASLSDATYALLETPLDTIQLCSAPQAWYLGDSKSPIGYQVSTLGGRLTIRPRGFAQDSTELVRSLVGYRVLRSTTADLDVDTYPELYIFLQSLSPDRRGALIAYRPNKGKSLSEIYLPRIEDNGDIAKYYEGFDEMEIVENRLCRRFPMKRRETAQDGPRMMQVQYVLRLGEASPRLMVERLVSF